MNGIRHVVWMYDVNCKYKINSFHRCFTNPFSPLDAAFKDRLRDPSYISYLVNVWHGNSHKPECADEHSICNTAMKGMVTGEEIESGWVKMNRKQYTTREMDAGARADSITIHMIEHNKDKLKRMGKPVQVNSKMLIKIHIGERLHERYWEAKKQVEEHSKELNSLEEALNALDPETVPRYRTRYQESGGDQFRPDPSKFSCESSLSLSSTSC